jgi:hypothetical protein
MWGVGESVEMQTTSGGWRRGLLDPLCGAPIKRLTYSRPRRSLLVLSSFVTCILLKFCYAINTVPSRNIFPNRHTPASKNKHFALPIQDMPSATARSAMRLGFGCLLNGFSFVRHRQAAAALFDIHQSGIFPSAMHLAPIIRRLYVRVCFAST